MFYCIYHPEYVRGRIVLDNVSYFAEAKSRQRTLLVLGPLDTAFNLFDLYFLRHFTRGS